jgi:hypothetical protein
MLHLFEETIAGRLFRIEVRPVSDKWRAQLKRVLGVPQALMPFYGRTPDEAAGRLTAWLTRAYAGHGEANASDDQKVVDRRP